jgi:hypothetical protein
MMSQQGMVVDVWAAAAKYLKERRNKCAAGGGAEGGGGGDGGKRVRSSESLSLGGLLRQRLPAFAHAAAPPRPSLGPQTSFPAPRPPRREEARARAARYSAAQEAARRAAAEALAQRQSGWFATFASKFGISNMAAGAAAAMNEAVFGSYSSGA